MDLNEQLARIASPKGYSILRELGRGGMGAVYLMQSNSTGEQRALKIILPRIAADTVVQGLFLREMANCRALSHPQVVRTYDAGFEGGVFFLIMEFCNDGSLDQFIKKEGQQQCDRAVQIILDVLSGLQYAHTAEISSVVLADGSHGRAIGLVHRDLKPQNIFLVNTASGRTAKVGDMGLAKAFELAGLSGVTLTGDAAGTPMFMPRQQAIDFKYAKPEVDVWAAAASLYFMLTGFTPRDFPKGRDPWQVVYRTDPVPILQRGIRIPARLAQVIDEALVDRPHIKIKSAAEFRNCLEQAG